MPISIASEMADSKENGVAPINEAQLVVRAQKGDHQAFTTLLQLYDSRVMNLILRFTANQYDRDDLYQNIFTACFVALPRYNGNASFYTWLYRIGLNQCIDFMRKHKPLETLQDKALHHCGFEQQQQLNAVHQAMKKLNGPQRISFHLFYIEQWNTEEIAQVLECGLGTVKSHLDRARKKVRQHQEVALWLIND